MAEYKQDLAAIHCGKKEAGLSDAPYRDLLERETGQRSAKGLKPGQRRAVLIALSNLAKPQKKDQPKRAGSRPLTDGPQASKLRALWLSAYHLGIVFDPSEQALHKWASKATGVDSLNWNAARDTNKAIEGLKAWLERASGMPFETGDGLACKRWVILAQWDKLALAGVVAGRSFPGARNRYLSSVVGHPTCFEALTEQQADKCIEALGRKVRKITKAKGGAL